MNVEKSGPGRITGQQIHLLDCHFAFQGGEKRELKYGLALVNFTRELSDDRTKLSAILSFNAFHKIEHPLVHATFRFRIVYAGEGDLESVWGTLKDEIILAHCIPYVRELLSSMTSRMPVPPLVIEMVNAYGMFQRFKELTHAVETARQASP
jgi:preprotein translocase subunit SecB